MSRPAEAVHEAAPLRQGNAAAVEHETGQADVACAFAQKHRGAAVENEFCRATYAYELRAVLQPKQPGAVDARRQRQWHLGARSFIDRALQIFGLILRAAGTHAILRGIAAERGSERRGARGFRRQRQRAGRRRRRKLQ